MEVDYYSKYLKYKSKYLELKAQLGGDCEEGWYPCSEIDICKQVPTYVIRSSREYNCEQFKEITACKNCTHEGQKHKLNKKTKKYVCSKCKTCESFIPSFDCGNCGKPLDKHMYKITCKSKPSYDHYKYD